MLPPTFIQPQGLTNTLSHPIGQLGQGEEAPLVVVVGGQSSYLFGWGGGRVPECPVAQLCVKRSSEVDEVSFMKLCAMYGIVVVWTRAHSWSFAPMHNNITLS